MARCRVDGRLGAIGTASRGVCMPFRSLAFERSESVFTSMRGGHVLWLDWGHACAIIMCGYAGEARVVVMCLGEGFGVRF